MANSDALDSAAEADAYVAAITDADAYATASPAADAHVAADDYGAAAADPTRDGATPWNTQHVSRISATKLPISLVIVVSSKYGCPLRQPWRCT